MSYFDRRFVVVALVVGLFASSVATGVFVDRSGDGQMRHTVQPTGPDPDIQIRLQHQNITPDNETQFVLFLRNREESERSLYLALQVKILHANGSLDALIDDDTATQLGDSLVWHDGVELAPSEYRVSYGAIAEGAEPGTYPIYVTTTYLKADDIVTRSVNTTLEVSPVDSPTTPPSTTQPPSVWEGIQGWLNGMAEGVATVLTNSVFQASLAAIGAFATLAALLVQLYGRKSFFNALTWPIRRVRGVVKAYGPFEQQDSERDESN